MIPRNILIQFRPSRVGQEVSYAQGRVFCFQNLYILTPLVRYLRAELVPEYRALLQAGLVFLVQGENHVITSSQLKHRIFLQLWIRKGFKG